MSAKPLFLVAALSLCAALGPALGAQEPTGDIYVPDVGRRADVYAPPRPAAFPGAPAADQVASASSGPRVGLQARPVVKAPLVPGNRASSLGWSAGAWQRLGAASSESDEAIPPLLDVGIESLWHLPYLGNSVVLGAAFNWEGDLENDMDFMAFGLEASGRYYFSPRLPFWAGLRAGPAFYLDNMTGGRHSVRILGYADVGVSYPLGNLGLELRGSLFHTGSGLGLGLTVGYAFLKGR